MIKPFFNILLLSLSMLIIPVRVSANCAEIEILTIHDIDLGQLRARVGSSGWAYLGRDGELFTSSAIAQDLRSPSSLGLVRVTGPTGSEIQLRLERIKQDDADSMKILNFLLFTRGHFQFIQMTDDLYQLSIPNHQEKARMSVDIQVGAEIQIKSMKKAEQLAIRFQLTCMYY